ncbi:MAG: GH92 family glycosyl hydrolase [Bacteroidales bacterium]|nr:GH92 family glycosyl hydrolase [Bacteroidales bacterium]
MKKTLIILALGLAALMAASCCSRETDSGFDPVDLVNPLTGTASSYELSTGNTYPAIALPWGTHFWTPQTGRNSNGWTYTYSATKIRGLKQTHQPSPWINDYGSFSIMPVTTGPVYDEEGRQSWFSHKAETVKPYYYSVYLAEHDVVAELAPTERAAAFRLTYPQKDTSYLVVDAFRNGNVEVDMENNVIKGYSVYNHGGVTENFRNWFVVVSDTPFEVNTVDESVAMVGFKTRKGQQVNLRVASSFISPEQAETNLGELGDRTIDEVAQAGRDRWNEVLGRIKVEDGNLDNARTFYSCLYRSVLFPRDLSEVDASGKRVHYSPFNGEIREGYLFGDTGFWDTFRCLFPLLDLVYPDQEVKMQEGLVNTWKESGFLPEWASPGHRGCMVGNNSASVVAGAYIKGLRGYDAEELWKAVTHGAHAVHSTVSSTGRLGWEYYDSLGYVPCDVGIRENAARTLEYAYDDWAIYNFGKALGKSEEELAPYAKAAMNYKNLYDPEYKLMVGKNQDGTFERPFSPLKWGGDFTEGNSLHYTWSVFHDPQGLVDLMGGEEEYVRMLDSVFTIPPLFDDSYYGGVIHEIREMQVMNMGNYAHGNQPIQHMLYMYDWGGQPWKTQARVREVMDKLYNSNFDGYCGDEDNGQTSAWYVFSALGFYPVCPASDEYAIGTPLFKKVTISLPDGKRIVLDAPANSKDNYYIDAIKLNGKSWSKNYFKHSDLTRGAKIVYNMDSKPNTSRGTAAEDKPYSFSR